MNLLLLLSAMLSALTGAVSGGRAGATPQAVCARSVTVCAASTQVRAAATRPAQSIAVLAAVIAGPTVRALVVRAQPLYASRRRE